MAGVVIGGIETGKDMGKEDINAGLFYKFSKEGVMIKPKTARKLIIAVVLIGIAISSFYVTAAERGKEAIGKKLEESIGMPLLTGELWQKMEGDAKVSFIWGLWHVVATEHYLMDKYPDLKKDNFSSKFFEGSEKSSMTMNQMVALIDEYYQTNPDHIEKPVVGVLWHTVVRPNITTGIAGRPLKPEN